jgi:predicted PurR-regulated permease PerM
MHLFPELQLVFFVGFLAVVLATLFDYPVRFFSRFVPRPAAMAILALLLLGLGAGVVRLIVPVLVEQTSQLTQRLPAALERLLTWFQDVLRGDLLRDLGLVATPRDVLDAFRGQLGRLLLGVVPAAFGLLVLVGHTILVLVLALFLAYNPEDYFRGMLRLIPREKEPAAREIGGVMVGALRSWMLGTVISMSVVGILTGIGLLIVGVDLWLALAVLAFFGEFVPFLGPILSAIPGVLVGLAASPTTAFWVLVVYVVVQQVESNVLQPIVMRWAVKIRPGLLLIWQLAFVTAFGLIGLMVATPLLGAIQAGVRRGYVQRVLGRMDEDQNQHAEREEQAAK